MDFLFQARSFFFPHEGMNYLLAGGPDENGGERKKNITAQAERMQPHRSRSGPKGTTLLDVDARLSSA
jgi:hypothetical protein